MCGRCAGIEEKGRRRAGEAKREDLQPRPLSSSLPLSVRLLPLIIAPCLLEKTSKLRVRSAAGKLSFAAVGCCGCDCAAALMLESASSRRMESEDESVGRGSGGAGEGPA
jgi:hypothetical protein